MRISPLHSYFEKAGASFAERFGAEVVTTVSGAEKEYATIRNAVGVTDFSYVNTYRIPEETGIDFLDDLLAGNVARVRFGRVLHTFLADESGELVADCYVANNDEEFVMVCESIVDDDTLDALLEKNGASEAGLEKLTATHTAISIDGYQAWQVARDLFGTDVLGLPYLSIEVYPFEGSDIRLFRAGKTSEFGYLLVAPNDISEKLVEAAVESAAKYEGGLCGTDVHNDVRLEGRFFNIFAEGLSVKDPLPLGLQWMIDFDKENFIGAKALFAKRETGVATKIVGVKITGNNDAFTSGAEIFDGDTAIGSLCTTCYSQILDSRVGLVVLPSEVAYAGLSFTLGAGGPTVETISMPPIMPKSLTVKLDEM